jgi:hypothetical protein
MSYGYPQYPGYGPPPPRPVASVYAAAGKLRGPALGLMLVSGVNILVCLIVVIFALQSVLAQRQTQVTTETTAESLSLVSLLTSCGVSMIISGMILVGTQAMRSVRSFAMCVTISIIAVIPICSPLFALGVPFGIWALVVLMQPEVRYAFRGRT